MPTDAEKVAELELQLANENERTAAERELRHATEDRLRDANDDLRRQAKEIAEMQRVVGQLRGKIAELESRAQPMH